MKAISLAIMMTGALLVSSAAAAERGRDGHVSIIYWQAPSILNPYLSGGTKDLEAASMILEPLARFDESGNLTPWLAASVPTVANGGVSADLKTITWKLREGLLWSDGSPVTAADVVFTAEYCRDPAGGCSQLAKFDDVTAVEAVDDLTVEVTFGIPKPYPYAPFVGATSPILQKAQFADCTGARAPECTEANFNPIGTGPFRVTEFRSNDVISLAANPHYRDPAKPVLRPSRSRAAAMPRRRRGPSWKPANSTTPGTCSSLRRCCKVCWQRARGRWSRVSEPWSSGSWST